MSARSNLARGLAIALIAVTSLAHALPVELKDSNGTKYNINTQVIPLNSLSDASGALTNATFVKPVTVTSYYIAFTPWFFFLTTYTVQRQIKLWALIQRGSGHTELPRQHADSIRCRHTDNIVQLAVAQCLGQDMQHVRGGRSRTQAQRHATLDILKRMLSGLALEEFEVSHSIAPVC